MCGACFKGEEEVEGRLLRESESHFRRDLNIRSQLRQHEDRHYRNTLNAKDLMGNKSIVIVEQRENQRALSKE